MTRKTTWGEDRYYKSCEPTIDNELTYMVFILFEAVCIISLLDFYP